VKIEFRASASQKLNGSTVIAPLKRTSEIEGVQQTRPTGWRRSRYREWPLSRADQRFCRSPDQYVCRVLISAFAACWISAVCRVLISASAGLLISGYAAPM